MQLRRPWMSKALERFWKNIQIAEEHFQNEGECDWKYHTPTYKAFDFKQFDPTFSKCKNLRNFASNAKQFLDNFVCMDGHELPRRTLIKWRKQAENLSELADKLSNYWQPINWDNPQGATDVC